MATVVLVRHALTATTGVRLTGRQAGVHLDDRGRAQAERLAEELAVREIDAVYSSPLERTCETAVPVAERLGLEVVELPAVVEVDFGTWTGRTLKQLRRRTLWRAVQQVPSRVTFPEGESLRAVQARAVDAVERLAAEHARGTVVVVSHADVIKAVVAHYLAMPLDAYQRLVIAPASVTELRLADGQAPILLRCNHTDGA